MALRGGGIPVPYYYPTTERNPTLALTQILMAIVQEAESVAELGTLSRGGKKTSKSHRELLQKRKRVENEREKESQVRAGKQSCIMPWVTEDERRDSWYADSVIRK